MSRVRSPLIAWPALLIVTGMAGYGAIHAAAPQAAPTDDAQRSVTRGHAHQLSQAFRDAAEDVLPSVVWIQKGAVRAANHESLRPDRGQQGNPLEGTPFGEMFRDERFKEFFREMPSQPRGHGQSMGSGVIIDEAGIILTNNHVVSGGGSLTIRLQDGREFEATDVKTDPKTDLAVVRIENAGPLKAARMGDSDAMQIGDWVLAVGHPFGLNDTVTAGIISAKSRGLGLADREEFLQTDAAINPGNSGGPLINLDGEVIGINTAISSRTGGYQGAGFAVPINLAHWVSQQLVESGQVRRAYLGVAIQPVTTELADQLELGDHHGALVSSVMPETPAAKAGLQAGDVIVRFDDTPVTNPRELQAVVERAEIGPEHELVVLRDGQEVTLRGAVEQLPSEFGTPAASSGTADRSSRFGSLGIDVAPLTEEVAKQLGLASAEGVVVTSVAPGSPAESAGLTVSSVIARVGKQAVGSVEEFEQALEDQSLEQGILLLVRDASGSRFIVIRNS